MKLKRISRRLLATLLVCAVVFSVSMSALASELLAGERPTVTLSEVDGAAVFSTNLISGSNLFQDFYGVMPGDELTTTITVGADSSITSQYRIYLYARVCQTVDAEGHPIDTAMRKEGFLDYLNLEVTQGGTVLGDASIGTGTGADGVLLGTFDRNQTVELQVALAVDIEMGNEFQGAKEYIDWVFYAQGIDDPDDPDDPDDSDDPDDPDDPGPGGTPGGDPGVEIDDDPTPQTGADPPTETIIIEEGTPLGDMPQTGDDSAILFWAVLAALSGGGICILLLTGRRKETAEV